tara:strand:- start:115 stop:1377 length:1263 start_codon:yes stop_codon:yes gene_type:complete
MNAPTVQSVKSNFDLTNLTEDELQEKIDFISSYKEDSLFKKLQILDKLLTVFNGITKDTDAQQIQFSNIIELLEEVNTFESLQLFNYLFGYYENKIFLPNAVISLKNLINVLSVIDKFPPNPRLPWPKVNGFLLFNEKTENDLLTPGTHQIEQDDFYGRVNVFDSEEDIVIGNLQTPSYNSRKNEIYKLFINFKIAKCIGKTPTIENLNLQSQEIIEEYKSWEIKNKNEKIDLDEYVSQLFETVYRGTEKEIKEQVLVPKKIDINSTQWDDLLFQAMSVKNQLLAMQTKYKHILDLFDSEGEPNELLKRNKLLIEVREFLNINKTKKEWLSLKIDERFLPDRNTIEAMSGGKGLMKRISALEGGVISFKRIYPIWIAQKLDKENSKLEVDKEFKRYERRYGMTKLNAEKMTIENEPVEEI